VKLLSWNVNGIRAIYKKGFSEWLDNAQWDIVCLQETKASADQVPKALIENNSYYTYFALGERKGYSGVGVFSKQKPKKVVTDIGVKACDGEGRIIRADFDTFILCNVYFPNGNASVERLAYKLRFYKAFLAYVHALVKKGKKVIFCGDINTAHTAIDLARPKENENNSGFLPEERAWIDACIAQGFTDSFRHYNNEPQHYTWWDYKTKARERDVGWRLDYFFVSKNALGMLKDAWIDKTVMGSDHCPVGIEIA